jgi:hypothetical protein
MASAARRGSRSDVFLGLGAPKRGAEFLQPLREFGGLRVSGVGERAHPSWWKCCRRRGGGHRRRAKNRLSRSLALTLSLALSLSHSLTLSLALSLSHTHTHTLSLSLSLSLTLTRHGGNVVGSAEGVIESAREIVVRLTVPCDLRSPGVSVLGFKQ